MQNHITLLIFIDAFGWEIYQRYGFLKQKLPYAQKLRTVLGYSSAAVPSILTGRLPHEHMHWSSFFYSPKASPFKELRKFGFLPKSLTNRGKVRHWFNKWFSHKKQYTGYFSLGLVPFEYLPYFDYLEKKDYFVPGGILETDTIFDWLTTQQISYHASDWRIREVDNIHALSQSIKEHSPSFAFLYLADLDGLMHQVGPEEEKVRQKLNWYETKITELIELIQVNYEKSHIYLCSDHGMKKVTQGIDLMGLVKNTGLVFGQDYVAIYDSTMARFWFLKDSARNTIMETFAELNQGHWLKEEEMKRFGCLFADQRFGEAIYLLNPGLMINPSFMNHSLLKGMHGYTPEDQDSDALLLSNEVIPDKVQSITQIRALIESKLT